jgi:hypothetical protein
VNQSLAPHPYIAVGDIFGGGRQAQQNNRGADLRYDLEIDLNIYVLFHYVLINYNNFIIRLTTKRQKQLH